MIKLKKIGIIFIIVGFFIPSFFYPFTTLKYGALETQIAFLYQHVVYAPRLSDLKVILPGSWKSPSEKPISNNWQVVSMRPIKKPVANNPYMRLENMENQFAEPIPTGKIIPFDQIVFDEPKKKNIDNQFADLIPEKANTPVSYHYVLSYDYIVAIGIALVFLGIGLIALTKTSWKNEGKGL